MPWTVPLTAVSNTALTASQWNASVRDNLNETAVAKATTPGSMFIATGVNSIAERIPQVALVATSETTASVAFGNLTTPGPAVTATTSAKALVIVSAFINNSTSGGSIMSWEVTGATALAPADTWGLEHRDTGAGGWVNASRCHLETALNAGSNVFTSRYRVTAGTGTFMRRHILVLPF